MKYYIATTNPHQDIEITNAYIRLVSNANLQTLDYSLTNTITAKNMKVAREIAKRAGYSLKNIRKMAMRVN